jgi:hypothetical protein
MLLVLSQTRPRNADILALCRISYNEASSLVQHGSAAYMKPLAQAAAQILLDTSAGESTPKYIKYQYLFHVQKILGTESYLVPEYTV